MANEHEKLEARRGWPAGTFPATMTTEPAAGDVDVWYTTVAPQTIADYNATSSEELLVDLMWDLYIMFKWSKRTKGAASISTPSGSISYASNPTYPSKTTIRKHGLTMEQKKRPKQYHFVAK